MKKILILVMSLLIIGGCSKANNNELQNIIKEDNYIIVDVRTKEEYDEGHLKDALNIPVEEIDENIFDETKTILVYCRSGNRSKTAYNTLIKNGYKAYDMGGYENITEFEKVK
jgi:rhodanese-related sulfurtransferase